MFSHLDALPYAIEAAAHSPCQSKRGVAIFNDSRGVVVCGWNHHPEPFTCDGSDRCKNNCGRTAIHAEQDALINVGAGLRWGASLLHIKIVDGLPVPSGGPSCLECSKLILSAGIATVWLLLEDGWKSYPAFEFHRLTAEHHGIILLPGAKMC